MKVIEIYTEQALESTVRENARGDWYVLSFNGFTFKIYQVWAQLMVTPRNQKDSGNPNNKSAKAFIAELLKFIKDNSHENSGALPK